MCFHIDMFFLSHGGIEQQGDRIIQTAPFCGPPVFFWGGTTVTNLWGVGASGQRRTVG